MSDDGLKKVIDMDSVHEIGFMEGSINETTSYNPVAPFGINKNMLRELAELLCKQNSVLFQWLRGYYIE